ncbi:hypothetical protein EZV62_016917 [Acer yangbiense]|uniref:RING-type E3 ubiquitin transferase n=1 Tax=Acer yangbiense TaxID=1000413 RepID=A0A5C7HQN7_9ROSI|nr:hypothetical protein EZV62_016917 [Acer yangbiense]
MLKKQSIADDPIKMEEETIIIAALSTLSSSKLSDLTHSILSLTNSHLRRLSAVLSSPSLFFLTLHHLHSLSLPDKILLISRHLLSSLHQFTSHFEPTPPPPPPPPSYFVRHSDIDAVLLLLLLCEVHQLNPEALQGISSGKWRAVLSQLYTDTMLTLTGGGGGGYSTVNVLMQYIEMVIRCRRFVGVMARENGGKEWMEVAASPAAVVALPSVEVIRGGGGVECVICKEEMREGRDVCELPCEHSFHWICILPWFRKRNTCPCCRFRLPTDDVFGEIQRLWELLVKASSSGGLDGE